MNENIDVNIYKNIDFSLIRQWRILFLKGEDIDEYKSKTVFEMVNERGVYKDELEENIKSILYNNDKKAEISFYINNNYYNICKYLKYKYGPVEGNYFIKKGNNTVQNKYIKRSNSGLEIHHIMSDKAMRLSNLNYFNNLKGNDAEKFKNYQKKEFLVYCNYFEHFILHDKISSYSADEKIRIYNKNICDKYFIPNITNILNNDFKYDKNVKSSILKLDKNWYNDSVILKRITVLKELKDDFIQYIENRKLIINDTVIN